MDKIKEQLTKLPPALTLLKICSMICGGLLAIMGVWLFFTSIITFSFSDLIIGFYLTIGGLLMILAELQFKWFIKKLNFLGYHFGRGVFYLFVGTLTFAVFGLDGVISIFLMIVGILVIICGLTQIVFQFIAKKLESSHNSNSSSSLPTGTEYEVEYGDTSKNFYGDEELQDPNFDPNAYSGGIDINKPLTGSYGGPQAGSPSNVGLQTPTYDIEG